jgi:hypothetical protein
VVVWKGPILDDARGASSGQVAALKEWGGVGLPTA